MPRRSGFPFKPLSYRIRAGLFLQLSRLETAGLPYDRAIATIKLAGPAARRLKVMQELAARGVDAAKAGQQSGLFTPLEARLVGAALNAGSPARTYQRLSDYCSRRAMQSSAIKSRLMLPGLMLALALVIAPLPSLVAGTLGVAGYIWQVTWPVLLIAAIGVGVRLLGKSFPRRMPLFGPIFIRANLRDFFESLGLMLEAGIPMLAALPPALQTVSDGDIRRELTRVRQQVEQRKTFAAALEGVPYLRGSRVLAFAHAGEASGTLPEMLMRHAAMETEAIGNFYEQAAVWVPRILYLLVAIKIALGILSSGGVITRVPGDL